MKILCLFLTSLLCCSCGKEAENSEPTSSTTTTTPELRAEDGLDTEVSNNQFTLSIVKSEFEQNEVILLKVENTGMQRLNHQGFSFSSSPSDLTATKLNCFEYIDADEICTFSIVFKNPIAGNHKLIVRYNDNGFIEEVEMNLRLLEDDSQSDPIQFLFQDHHSKVDCNETSQYSSYGQVVRLGANDFCQFRSKHHNTAEDTPIEINPLSVFINHNQDPNAYYCPTGWTLDGFKFTPSVVVEKTNFFGGKRDVVIPAGESREVCLKRKFFGGCKESKVFYSRLTNVTCY